MKMSETKINSTYKKFIYMSGTIIVMFCVFFLAFVLLSFPKEAGEGLKRGLSLCFSSVVPSLFPFMILSSFFAESSLCGLFASLFNRLTKKVFALPGICSSVILFSLIGGFPVGASMTSNLFKNRLISNSQAQRLMMFCICPGPAFVIGTVGVSMLGSKKAGLIIYASLVLSALLIGVFTRLAVEEDKNEELFLLQQDKTVSYAKAFVNSVSKSTSSILLICGWISLFSAIISILDVFFANENIKTALICFLEVTSGCNASAGPLPLAFISGIIGWGGLCTHFQIMPDVLNIKMKIGLFALFRALNAALSTVICHLLLMAFPVEATVINQVGASFELSQKASYSVSACMLIMCVLLLLGNSFVLRRNKVNIDET